MEKELIQVTVTAEELLWLYCAAAAGHFLSLVRCSPNEKERTQAYRDAWEHTLYVVATGHELEYSGVFERMQKLLKASSVGERIEFASGT